MPSSLDIALVIPLVSLGNPLGSFVDSRRREASHPWTGSDTFHVPDAAEDIAVAAGNLLSSAAGAAGAVVVMDTLCSDPVADGADFRPPGTPGESVLVSHPGNPRHRPVRGLGRRAGHRGIHLGGDLTIIT